MPFFLAGGALRLCIESASTPIRPIEVFVPSTVHRCTLANEDGSRWRKPWIHAPSFELRPDHDELVLVLEGECGFRVGEETRRVQAGDLMFIPRDTVHGPIVDSGRVALLSVFAPFFDRTKKNIRWARDAFA